MGLLQRKTQAKEQWVIFLQAKHAVTTLRNGTKKNCVFKCDMGALVSGQPSWFAIIFFINSSTRTLQKYKQIISRKQYYGYKKKSSCIWNTN